MQFKLEEDGSHLVADQYHGLFVHEGTPILVDQSLKDVAMMLDILAKYNTVDSAKEITITDLISFKRTTPSLHPVGRAMDIRINDWSRRFRIIIEGGILPLLRQINPDFHYLFEESPTPGHEGWTAPHLHIQIGKLNKET